MTLISSESNGGQKATGIDGVSVPADPPPHHVDGERTMVTLLD
jgi:hypothetical protein